MKKQQIDNWLKKKHALRKDMLADVIFNDLIKGDIGALSRGITLIESQNESHRLEANKLVQKCLPKSGNSIRVGITGVPGVGKSTFIESFGSVLLMRGKKVAVLAVDPSSSYSKGSILGDKTRMQNLSIQENVFIRPSPAGETLGGVARKTRESIILCEAAGFDYIIIETVGVGQSETTVKSMVDFFLLLMLSGAGDELQGIKKGIMEMADALVITKADGDNLKKAKLAAREYRNALHLFPPHKNGWTPKVEVCSAVEKSNIEKVFDIIHDFQKEVEQNGCFYSDRKLQDEHWFEETLKDMILSDFFLNEDRIDKISELKNKVLTGELSSFQAAEDMYKIYKDGRKD